MKQDIASDEEEAFSWLCEELVEAGYLNNFGKCKTYELIPKVENHYTEQLKTKTKDKIQTIENNHVYTPDFELHWNEKAKDIFIQTCVLGTFEFLDVIIPKTKFKLDKNCFWQNSSIHDSKCIIEIKGGYSKHGQLQGNAIDRKLLLQKYGLYVNLVKIPDLFKDTFTPKRYLLTKTGKQNRIIHFPTKTLKQYAELRQQINLLDNPRTTIGNILKGD